MRRATALNKHEEDARHFYMSFSLHCFRSMSRCFATFIGSESNDFFLQDVICHGRGRDWGKETRTTFLRSKNAEREDIKKRVLIHYRKDWTKCKIGEWQERGRWKGKQEWRWQKRIEEGEVKEESLTYIDTLFSTRGRAEKFRFFDAITRSAWLARSSSLCIIMGDEVAPWRK